jgi:hypothetical protein
MTVALSMLHRIGSDNRQMHERLFTASPGTLRCDSSVRRHPEPRLAKYCLSYSSNSEIIAQAS